MNVCPRYLPRWGVQMAMGLRSHSVLLINHGKPYWVAWLKMQLKCQNLHFLSWNWFAFGISVWKVWWGKEYKVGAKFLLAMLRFYMEEITSVMFWALSHSCLLHGWTTCALERQASPQFPKYVWPRHLPCMLIVTSVWCVYIQKIWNYIENTPLIFPSRRQRK